MSIALSEPIRNEKMDIPSHPMEGVPEVPEIIKTDWSTIEKTFREFISSVGECDDAISAYIVGPSVAKWNVTIGEWEGVTKSIGEVRAAILKWSGDWQSIFFQDVPISEIDEFVEIVTAFVPPVIPIPVTEAVASMYISADQVKEAYLGAMKAWIDSWTLYIKRPATATWEDVVDSWHKFRDATPEVELLAIEWKEKIPMVEPPKYPREEARNVQRIMEKAGRDAWREDRRNERVEWREDRRNERVEWREDRRKG